MSADFETTNFRVYGHGDRLYLFAKEKDGLDHGNNYTITKELVREFQPIIDMWKSNE